MEQRCYLLQHNNVTGIDQYTGVEYIFLMLGPWPSRLTPKQGGQILTLPPGEVALMDAEVEAGFFKCYMNSRVRCIHDLVSLSCTLVDAPCSLCVVNLSTARCVSNQRRRCLGLQTAAPGEVDAQTHLSPASTLTQTGQFTYQAEQKMQCLSVTLFLSPLNENQSQAICEIHPRWRVGGSGMLHPDC